MKLKNMIGGASEYEVSIDEKGMQPMNVIDEDGLLQAALESKKLIKIGEGLYLDAIKSIVYVFEDGKINKYDLQYGSSGGGLSAYGETYYYIKSDGKRIYLDNLSKYYENFIEFEEQSYNFIPSIMEFPKQRRPRGTIAIYRDDSKEGEAITAELGKFKEEYDEARKTPKPAIGTLSQLASSELSRLTTGEEKPTFHIYTTGLNKLLGGFDCFKCFKVFMNLFNEHIGTSVSVSIFHYVIDSDKQEGNTYNKEELMALSNPYPTYIIPKLLTPEIIIDTPAQFKFLFDCSGMVYNHPLKGLVFNREYFDFNEMKLPSGLEFDKHIELFQGMHCPLSYDPKKYFIKIQDDKVLTVYDKLVEFNSSVGEGTIIDIDSEQIKRGYSYLPDKIYEDTNIMILGLSFEDESMSELMLELLEKLEKYINIELLDLLCKHLHHNHKVEKEYINNICLIMLDRIIIGIVWKHFYEQIDEYADYVDNGYFNMMIYKYGKKIRSYIQNPGTRTIDDFVRSIIELEEKRLQAK